MIRRTVLVALAALGLCGPAAAQAVFDPFDSLDRVDAWEYVGKVFYFAGPHCPTMVGASPARSGATAGWLLLIRQYPTLFQLLGTRFGGNGINVFKLPEHAAPGGLTSCIVTDGVPPGGAPREDYPLLAQVVRGPCAPWFAPTDGSLLPIGQHQAVFALVGNRYGGDGRTTFAVPDMPGWCIALNGIFPRFD